jgi:hypothetical protein
MSLTEAEMKILMNYEARKKRHALAQAKYRKQQKEQNPDYKADNNEYMREYNKKQNKKINEIKEKLTPKITKTPTELIKSVVEVPKVDKRTRRGKRKPTAQPEIKPSYKTRQEPLKLSTIKGYLDKADIIQRIFKNKSLTPEIKAELKKLLNDNPNINEDLIINEMEYLKNPDLILTTLKEHYPTATSFKTYLNIIVVILSHLETLNNNYQILTKINFNVNKDIQDKRDDNALTPEEREKIIKLDRTTIIKGLETLKDDKKRRLIFALYTLQAPMRLDYRNMRITNQTNKDLLQDEYTNYLITSTKPMKFIFNDYKTSRAYKQKEIEIKDDLLNNIIDEYIKINKLKQGDYLLSQKEDKRKQIDQGNFSTLIKETFYKVYNINTSLRFIRISHIINFIDRPNKPTNNDKKKFAEDMAHSPQEQSKYYKIMNID